MQTKQKKYENNARNNVVFVSNYVTHCNNSCLYNILYSNSWSWISVGTI